ncbi:MULTISPECIES: ABC transporter substrate-binding protein [unclassified Chelatococcus]|uniref:ABC transporter substrate-binding protein n=1 Tax=unclassified Chelatococcus TaxID=2638111 RepID=UPI001BCBE898|nr:MULTISPECIES: ABC transporter substrate-binding protein [unclassified Chelatococcus]MBS7701211.1 carbohydrate ABC transporter substrate-binding protein [Chelatococcus sp. YT9]MBX3557342.1 carbohydrate ABC transporter substrate-binding protein [Chelatococcus sp.]
MSVEMNRRALLRQGASLIGAAAASSLPLASSFSQEKVRVRFAGYVESQEQLTQTLAALKLYTQKNPNVEIIPEFTSFGAFTDKIATETAGGNSPDMFSVNVDLLAEYARRGVTTPLDSYIPNPINLSDYLQSAVNAAKFDGKQYAIPNDAIGPAIITNASAFEKAGVKIPADMWTWEELAETASALNKALGPRFWGVEDAGGNYIPCDIFLRSRGKSMFTQDHRLGFELEDMEAWYAYWQKLRDTRATPPGDVQALAGNDDPSTSGVVAGRAAMNITLTDSFAGFQALTQDNLILHMMPNGFRGGEMKQRHYCYAGNSTTVSAKSANQKQVIDIIRFMHLDPDGAKTYYVGSGMIPCSKAARDAFAATGSEADRKIIAYLDVLQKEPAAPRYPGVPGMTGMLTRANEGVAFGKLTPKQAAEQFVREVSARLKK